MYLPRALTSTFKAALEQSPVVVLTGPRQSGKTTFVREVMPRGTAYLSLDDPLERDFARVDPNGFLDRLPGPTIVDEIQHVPELSSIIKTRVDAERAVGRWVLTGSQQYALMAGVMESLAGRATVLELLPMTTAELGEERTLAESLWWGFYPEPATRPERRRFWLPGYLRTYVERDVRQMRQIKDLAAFEHFVGLAAAAHGQTWNAARLSRETGITKPTIKSWAGLLEAAYLGVRVPPYFRNLGKRLTKAPKWFFLDPALVCALTRQPSAEAASVGAMGGALFEGLVVSEALKAQTNAGLRPEVYHWRSRDQLEVDLLVRTRDGVVPVEIKRTSTPRAAHSKGLTRFREAEPECADAGLVVCSTREPRDLPGGHRAIHWRDFGPWLQAQQLV